MVHDFSFLFHNSFQSNPVEVIRHQARPEIFTNGAVLTREQRFVLLLRKNLARPWDQSDYAICRTGLLMTRNSRHSAASITMLFYQSTKNQATKSGTLLAH